MSGNVFFHNTAALKAVKPADVEAYLERKLWRLERRWERMSRWRKNGNEVFYEVDVPTDMTLRDYAIRMSETLQTLSRVEKRTQLEVYADLKATLSDDVRARLKDVLDEILKG